MINVNRLRWQLGLEIASIEEIGFVVAEVGNEGCTELDVKRR